MNMCHVQNQRSSLAMMTLETTLNKLAHSDSWSRTTPTSLTKTRGDTKVECHSRLKRIRQQKSQDLKRVEKFDLDCLVKVTKSVEESIAFPTIEWCDDDDDDDDDDESLAEPAGGSCISYLPSKRRCHGLVRRKRVDCGLNKLGDLMSQSAFVDSALKQAWG